MSNATEIKVKLRVGIMIAFLMKELTQQINIFVVSSHSIAWYSYDSNVKKPYTRFWDPEPIVNRLTYPNNEFHQ